MKGSIESAKKTTTNLLVLSIVAAAFIGFNGQTTAVKLSVLTYAVLAFGIIVLINGTKNTFQFNLVGNLFSSDTIIGLVTATVFIVLNQLNSSLSIGYPQAFIDLEPAMLILAVVVIAPIVEELVFRGWLYPFLYKTTGNNNFIAIPAQAVLFSLFHFLVYGGSQGLLNGAGLFIAAFLFATVAAFLVLETPGEKTSNHLGRTIITHAVFNFYLLNTTHHYFGLA